MQVMYASVSASMYLHKGGSI